MRVYTYFNFVPECKDDPLINLWEKSWKSHGWEPVILRESDARNSDPEMCERFNRSLLLESRNPVEYTRAAMLRWVAMSVVNQPCLHVDWDVMCNGLSPEDVRIDTLRPTFLAGSSCPCAIAGAGGSWRLLAALLELAPFLPNFSREALVADSCDQYGTGISHPDYYIIHAPKLCLNFAEDEGWKDAPMIHFPNRLTPYPRSETVKAVPSLFR